MKHFPASHAPARLDGIQPALTQSRRKAGGGWVVTLRELFCVVFAAFVAGVALGLVASAWLNLRGFAQ